MVKKKDNVNVKKVICLSLVSIFFIASFTSVSLVNADDSNGPEIKARPPDYSYGSTDLDVELIGKIISDGDDSDQHYCEIRFRYRVEGSSNDWTYVPANDWYFDNIKEGDEFNKKIKADKLDTSLTYEYQAGMRVKTGENPTEEYWSDNTKYFANGPRHTPDRPERVQAVDISEEHFEILLLLETQPDGSKKTPLTTFETSATDPDGDDVRIGWYWDFKDYWDGREYPPDEYSDFYSSGATVTASHSWDSTGVKKIKTESDDGNRYYRFGTGRSEYISYPLDVRIADEDHIVQAPEIVDGPSTVFTGVEYKITVTTPELMADGLLDKVKYGIDWNGDGTLDEWKEKFYPTGQSEEREINIKHTWDTQGDFAVKVKAQDEWGIQSDWSEPLEITVIKGKIKTVVNICEFFLKSFPLLQRFFINF